jgi:hypothetical protein
VDGSSGEAVLVVCHVWNYVKGSWVLLRTGVGFEKKLGSADGSSMCLRRRMSLSRLC